MNPNDYHRRYRFIKTFPTPEGSFKPGDEITLVGDRMYFNGGFLMPTFYAPMMNLIKQCESDPNFKYLRRVHIPYNKC